MYIEGAHIRKSRITALKQLLGPKWTQTQFFEYVAIFLCNFLHYFLL